MKRLLKKYLYFLLFIPVFLIFLLISDFEFNFESKRDICAKHSAGQLSTYDAIKKLSLREGTPSSNVYKFCEYYKK